MSFWDWLFGKGKHLLRSGPAHSSDRHGFWKDLWKLRKALDIDPEHSGSVDIYDHFGCPPYNDNDIKRARRAEWRPVLRALTLSKNARVHVPAWQLLESFDVADSAVMSVDPPVSG